MKVNQLFESILPSIAGKIVLATLVTATAATSTFAGMKLIKNEPLFEKPTFVSVQNKKADLSVDTGEDETQEETTQGSNQPTNTPSQQLSPTLTPTTAPTAKITPRPTVAKLQPTTTPTSTAQNSNACIITLFGQQFDVTSLRSTHSGGDVFKCGTDQTALYQSKHGTSLSRMQPYLAKSSGTSTTTPTAGQTSTIKKDNSDDESESEKERYIKEKEDEREDERGEYDD